MSPAFYSGDIAVAGRWPWSRFRAGQVVLVRHPHYRLIIKRISAVSAEQDIRLEGDHPQSTSSQAMGWINQRHIVGRVWLHLRAS